LGAFGECFGEESEHFFDTLLKENDMKIWVSEKREK
jgi:hypothetical protein